MAIEFNALSLSAKDGAGAASGAGGAVRDEELGLLCVASSPTGSDVGAAASQLALDVVRAQVARNRDLVDRFRRNPTDELRARLVELLKDGMSRASREVFALGRRQSAPVPVVMDVALLAGGEAFVAHVGDGRVYLARRGLLHRLTVDHAESEASGLEPAAARPGTDRDTDAPQGRLTRALGREPQVHVETLSMQIAPGDCVLVAGRTLASALSDGDLRAVVTDRTIGEITERLQAVAESLGSTQLLAAVAVVEGGSAGRESRDRLAMLSRTPLFAYCTEAELLAVSQVTRPRRYPAGSPVMTQGVAHQEIFVVVDGTLDVIKDGKEIAVMGPGSNFGEMSMLDDPRASATVRTGSDVEVLVIPRDAFFGLLRADPTFAVKVLWNMLLRLSANLRTTSARLAELTEGDAEHGKEPWSAGS